MCLCVSYHPVALLACHRTYNCCIPFALFSHGTNSTRWGQEGHILLCLWRSEICLGMVLLVGWQAACWLPPGILPDQQVRYWFPLVVSWWQLIRRLYCGRLLPRVQDWQVPLPYLWFCGKDGHCGILPCPIRAIVRVYRDDWRQSDVWNLSMFCRRQLSVAIPCTSLGTCRLCWRSEMQFVVFVLT